MELRKTQVVVRRSDEEFRRAFAEEDLLHRISLRVLQIRKARGHTQHQLATLLGTKQPEIARIEGGFQNLSVRRLARIAFVLDSRPEDFVSRETPQVLRPDWVPAQGQAQVYCHEVWGKAERETQYRSSEREPSPINLVA